MKKLVVIGLIFMMLLVVSACSGEGGSLGSDGKFDIVESAYLVDKDSGDYSVVVIVENNTGSTIKEALCLETGFDENGKKLNSGGIHAAASFAWISDGEKEAYMYTTADVPDLNILEHYEALPDKLEWKVTEAKADHDLTPLGISIGECSMVEDYDEGADYEITIRNDSETDYHYDAQSMYYQTDVMDFNFEVVAVFRDSEGNLRDAVMMNPRPNLQKDLPAGSETNMTFYSNHVCRDEDLTPEYYLCISNYELH